MWGVFMDNSKLIVALDVPNLQEADRWIDLLRPRVSIFKVGNILFTKGGPQVVERIHQRGGEVFLDLKFHDIPNTVAEACCVASDLGVFMLNLHIVGGGEMLREAVSAIHDERRTKQLRRPFLLGVTLLTHLDPPALREVGWDLVSLEEEVIHLATFAKANGLDGVVCSPQEIGSIRRACGKDFLIVAPGIRPSGTSVHDQKRVSTPKEAIAAGADYIVVGRPILESKDPLGTVESILEEIK